MAIMIEMKHAMITSIKRSTGDNYEGDWRLQHLNNPYVATLYQSEKKCPGKHFIKFVHEVDDNLYLNTSFGDVEYNADHSGYTLKTQSSIYEVQYL